jgi:hypothetical protein
MYQALSVSDSIAIVLRLSHLQRQRLQKQQSRLCLLAIVNLSRQPSKYTTDAKQRLHPTTMTPSKTTKQDRIVKPSFDKLSPGNKHNQPTSRFSQQPSSQPAYPATPAPRKTSYSPATQRKPSATPKPASPPQPTPPRRYSAAPKPTQPTRPNPDRLTPKRKSYATPQINQTRRPSATPKPASPKPSPRKLSSTPKPPSPPKPDWIAPLGQHCSSSPSQIPLPVFVSSVRKDVSASSESSLGKGTGGLCTPVPAPRRHRSGVVKTKTSSPLVCEVSGEGDAAILVTKDSGHEDIKQEIKGLGLSFKDPFSSTLGSGSGSGSGIVSSISGIPGSGQTTPRVRNFGDVGEAASPISPRPRFYTPTATSTTTFTYNATYHQAQRPESEKTAEGTSKRDSLSPTSASSTKAIPASKPPSSSKPISRIPHLRSPPSILPPSPSTAHPYIGKVHITPSCTSGALTHRLVCGHLVVTERVGVCGRNCGYEGEAQEKKNGRSREEGFVANIRDLDQVWGCPCCGSEVEKGRRCDAVLDEKFQ